MYEWQQHDFYPFTYEATGYECLECGKFLKLVTDSTMLVCEDKTHGPYWIV
jgi:hypothetical protein